MNPLILLSSSSLVKRLIPLLLKIHLIIFKSIKILFVLKRKRQYKKKQKIARNLKNIPKSNNLKILMVSNLAKQLVRQDLIIWSLKQMIQAQIGLKSFILEILIQFLQYNILQNQQKNGNLITAKQNKGHLNDQNKKKLLVKPHSFISVFDWMMQIASIMRLTRSTFYHACNIFYETYKKDQKILQNQNVQKYASACILISAKMDKSNVDYLDEVYLINKKRISKELITTIELFIYQKLNWKVPIYSLISEEVLKIFQIWNCFLQKCEKQSLIKKETHQILSLKLEYSQTQPLKNKVYGQILYVLDILVLNQAKIYMNTPVCDIQNYTNPIVMAMYSVFTIQLGDNENKDQFLLPLFKHFYRQEMQRSADQIDRFSKNIRSAFILFKFADQISKIPLTKDWKDVIQKDLQIYLPVKGTKRINNQ